MTDLLTAIALPRPAAAPGRGAARHALLRPRRDPRPAAVRGQPGPRDVPRHPHRGPRGWATRAATPCSPRSPRTARTWRRSRRWTPPASPRRSGSSGTSSCTTSGSACSSPTRSAAGSGARRGRRPRRRDLPAVRARRGAAGRAPGADRRPARGGAGVPRAGARPARSGSQVGIWQERRGALRDGPAGAVRRGARGGRGRARRRGARPARARAIAGANAALEAHARVDRADPRATPATTGRSAASATTSWSGCAPSATSTRTRSSQIGEEQLRPTSRRGAPRPASSTPTPTCAPSSSALKSDHPATFEEALDGYRDVMRRARAYLIEHGIATIPDDEQIEVIATPEYLRTVMPFAAYFSPARVRRRPARPVHRHAGRRRRPERDARALLGLDLEHEHPRGVPGPPPPARDRVAPPAASPGCSPTRPSSSRAGACTPSR